MVGCSAIPCFSFIFKNRKIGVIELAKRGLSLLLCLFVLLSCTIVVYGEDAVYSTVGGTWVKLTDTTYVMDTDGDGNYDVTLTKNGNNWVYSFVVADDTPQYYVYEDNIPSGYEIEGEGSRANPTLTSGGSVRYNHTPNVSDDGTQDGYYDNSLSYMKVVRLPGATSLDVEITYQGVLKQEGGTLLCRLFHA